MQHLSENKQLNKSVWLAFVGSLIWFVSIMISWAFSTWAQILSDITKTTFHSNLLVFFIYILYLKNPYSHIFKTNEIFVFAGTLLITAGIGFWTLIIPVYAIDLNDYLYNSEFVNFSSFNLLQFLWSHIVTQVLFIVVIKHIFQCRKKWHLQCPSTKKCLKYLFIYLAVVFSTHAFYSWLDKIPPAYGVFSNWNYNTRFVTTQTGSTKMFNITVLWLSHLLIILCGTALTNGLCWLSTRDHPNNQKFANIH